MQATEKIRNNILLELQKGLPICTQPYLEVAQRAGCTEQEVIRLIETLQAEQAISRFGLVVLHLSLGYHHNAMVVWEIEDTKIDSVGGKMSTYPFVHLCYQRQKIPKKWQYNLFCMIHAKSKEEVKQKVAVLKNELDLTEVRNKVLYTEQSYKQRGARYV